MDELKQTEIEQQIAEIAEKVMDLSAFSGGMKYEDIWERVKQYMES